MLRRRIRYRPRRSAASVIFSPSRPRHEVRLVGLKTVEFTALWNTACARRCRHLVTEDHYHPSLLFSLFLSLSLAELGAPSDALTIRWPFVINKTD